MPVSSATASRVVPPTSNFKAEKNEPTDVTVGAPGHSDGFDDVDAKTREMAMKMQGGVGLGISALAIGAVLVLGL